MIVGFCGKLSSGKDTAGERLALLAAEPLARFSFAAPLKVSAAALLDIDVKDWETYKNDPDVKIMLSVGWKPALYKFDLESGAVTQTEELEEPNVIREFTAREFLQRYGTESHRDVFGTDFWVEQALANYQPGQHAYVTDVRFPNEATAIRALNGIIVRIRGIDEATGIHVSETRLPDDLITFEIDNSIRDDDYENLDYQLASIAFAIGLPLRQFA